MDQQAYTLEKLAALREQIIARCNDEELRTLCADLGVEYDDLPASGRANKARELVAFLERGDHLPEPEAVLACPRPPAA
jgi:predicted RecB family endonuclease